MTDWAVTTEAAPVATVFDETSNSAWLTGADGAIRTVRLLDAAVRVRGTGYADPVAALPLLDGLRLVVVEQAGDLWLCRRDSADRPGARRVAGLDAPVRGALLGPDGSVLVLHDQPDAAGRVTAVSPDTGATWIVAADLPPLSAVVADEGRDRLVLLGGEETAGALDVLTVDLGTGSAEHWGAAPASTATVLPSPGGQEVLLCGCSDGHLRGVTPDGTVVADASVGASVVGLSHWGRLLLIATADGTVAAQEWDLDDPGRLPLTLPLGPVAVGGWVRMFADPGAVGLDPADVTYVLDEGSEFGTVSVGTEPPAPDGTVPVMLLGGLFPGEYHVVATTNATGEVLARRRFRVTTRWPDDRVGPPVVVTGSTTVLSWGGSGAVPAYTEPTPAPSTWNIAAVLVTTREGSFGADLESERATWKDRLIGGGFSVRSYYEEVSYYDGGSHGTTIGLLGDRVLGPVALDAGWGEVFTPNNPGDANGGWLTTCAGRKILANTVSSWLADQVDGYEIARRADAVVFLVRPASTAPVPAGAGDVLPTEYVYSHAEDAKFWRKDPATSTFSQGPRPIVATTTENPASLGLPPDEPTWAMCHELGHTLGLEDLYDANGDYPAEILAREVVGGDMMDDYLAGPHFSVANRIRLGWFRPAWLRRFDFTADPHGDTVELQAVETLDAGGPTGGRSGAVEVAVQDGWSYLFEYRAEQPGQLGDHHLDQLGTGGQKQLLLGTDVRVPRGLIADGAARPPILQLPRDVDGDGPVLYQGHDYQDSDVTNRDRMFDFTATATALPHSTDSALLQIDYVRANRPQLVIHPAPGRGDFRSGDIQLIPVLPNTASTGGPGLPEVLVVKGARNKIAVTVWNTGTLDADQVRIHVHWIPFTLTAGTPVPLPDPPPFAVAAGSASTVEVPWDLPTSVPLGGVEVDHFCVRVDIDRYLDPAHPESKEIVVFDNWAQSNFSTKWLRHGSPSERAGTVVTASNVLARDARYEFGGGPGRRPVPRLSRQRMASTRSGRGDHGRARVRIARGRPALGPGVRRGHRGGGGDEQGLPDLAGRPRTVDAVPDAPTGLRGESAPRGRPGVLDRHAGMGPEGAPCALLLRRPGGSGAARRGADRHLARRRPERRRAGARLHRLVRLGLLPGQRAAAGDAERRRGGARRRRTDRGRLLRRVRLRRHTGLAGVTRGG